MRLEDLTLRGFVALDIETTGLDSRRDAVVSLAAVPFVDGRPQSGIHTLVDPGRPIPETSTRIHGLTDAMVAGAPPIARVLPQVLALCDGHVVVGHGVDFDLAVLGRAARAAGLPGLQNDALDTRALAMALHPEWCDVSLEGLGDRLGVPVIGRHTAEGDALTAGGILMALLPVLATRRIETLPELLWFQAAAGGRRR
ncbi:MAG: 3'-5' exonuclease [Candidatus Rokuibacteriota bacterium]